MFIYADVLIIVNIYVDFLLIQSAKTITHSPMKTSRGIIAAMLGSLFSLVIFLPRLPVWLMMLTKLISSAVIVFTAFGYENRRIYLKRLFIFYLTAFIYGGLGTGLAYISGGKLLVSRNGILYADFSLPALVITSIAAYACIAVYKHFADTSEEGAVYTVIVSDCNKTVSFKAISDTGNLLKDGFTGKPVIVCPACELAKLYGDIPQCDGTDISASGNIAVMTRWRLIPWSTASGTGLIPVILPKEICIKNDQTGCFSKADAYLGASPSNNAYAVFHPKILI